jgi:NADPH:quinone reductase-like Zn-dependent oxidoreductase
MKAITIISDSGAYKAQLTECPEPQTRGDECLVKLKASALNRRDYWITQGKYPGIVDGVILGSDGCGEVLEGPAKWKGKTIIINPNINWGPKRDHQGPDYQILGLPTNGTLAEYIGVPADRVYEKPSHLTDEEAAALPLAGLTAYRALFTKAQAKPGDHLLVTGIGGGVSQYALQFARAEGIKVSVTSSHPEKLTRAQALGASHGYNYQDKEWWKQVPESEKFDAVIDSAAGNSINDYLQVIRPGGKIIVYGGTTGKTPDFDIRRLFWNQASVIGSTMGSDEEFQEMIDFVSRHEVKPEIDKVWKLEEGVTALESMAQPGHSGKTVLVCK